jgi:hypothetical protein
MKGFYFLLPILRTLIIKIITFLNINLLINFFKRTLASYNNGPWKHKTVSPFNYKKINAFSYFHNKIILLDD